MSWLSNFINNFKSKPPPPLPPAPVAPAPIIMPTYNPPPTPQLPPLPSIILNTPTPQPAPTMPTLGGNIAGKAATNNALGRSGRASTILTNRKKRRNERNTGFDTYANTTLGAK